MKRYNRVFTIVIDSLGIGALPDAAAYGDAGAHTLGHIAEAKGTLEIPHLRALGIANLCGLKDIPEVHLTRGYALKAREKSRGKDTMTGHWEMMGLEVKEPFRTFTDTGFPAALIKELERRTGHKVIGNKSASGTAIIEELGEEEIVTGHMIVYTSADSVMQICGNEETFGLDELYRCCEIARELTMREEWKVGRVIARPYIGKKKGEFKRTSNRHDYAVPPSGETVLEAMKKSGLDVIAVGKISDIFAGVGITQAMRSKSSVQGMQQAISQLDQDFKGLCFVNLVDFDALWGHRRNPNGYGEELERFDILLGEFIKKMDGNDLLIVTADHGNDPTWHGTDHTREYIPILCYSPAMQNGGVLPEADTFAVIGATVADNFSIQLPKNCIGYSLLKDLK